MHARRSRTRTPPPGCAAYRDASLADLRALVIGIDPGINKHAWSATLLLCEPFRLTAYDASYLELARRRQLSLATLDGELIRAAQAENVPLVGTPLDQE